MLVLSAKDLSFEECNAFQSFYPFENDFNFQVFPLIRRVDTPPLRQVREYITYHLPFIGKCIREKDMIAVVLPEDAILATCLISMLLSMTPDVWIIDFTGNVINGSIMARSMSYTPPKLPDSIQF